MTNLRFRLRQRKWEYIKSNIFMRRVCVYFRPCLPSEAPQLKRRCNALCQVLFKKKPSYWPQFNNLHPNAHSEVQWNNRASRSIRHNLHQSGMPQFRWNLAKKRADSKSLLRGITHPQRGKNKSSRDVFLRDGGDVNILAGWPELQRTQV